MPRYALYYAPDRSCPWQKFGAAWLGRSALDNQAVEQCRIDGLEPEVLRGLTEAPRRYGFHATFKAPFRLAADAALADLSEALDRFCRQQHIIELPQPEVVKMGQFLALGWSRQDDAVAALAAECVTRFDEFRAPPESAEIARRRCAGLSAREDQLLLRWGYPHVFDQFRLHMSLTGPVGDVPLGVARRVYAAASDAIAALASTRLRVDAISVYEEPAAGAPFRLVHRSRFGAGSGRLIYMVGPSGAGKDSLIDYARRNLPVGSPVRFARRAITRPSEPGGEPHIAVTPAHFAERESRQAFSMVWRANGQSYGIGNEVVEWLAAGDTVLVNGSRAHVAQAAAAFPQIEIVHIGARLDTLRERLRARGREASVAIEARLGRLAKGWEAPSVALHEIDNDGPLDEAGAKLMAILLPGSNACA